MKDTPSSPEAFAALRAAYGRLDEKHKRAIAKWAARSEPGMFSYWTKEARLPSGHDKKKVEGREGSYGHLLDKVMLEHEDREFAAAVVAGFVGSQERLMGSILGGCRPWKTQAEFEVEVDAQVSTHSSPFAGLAGAFLKCFPPETPAVEPKEASAKTEMDALLAQMDAHAVKLEGWAESARRAARLPPDEIAKAVEAANADADRFAALLAKHAAETGIAVAPWQSLEDLKSLVAKVTDALDTRKEIERLCAFLKDLSVALRTLQVSHRSSGARQRISEVRDRAASEMETAAGQQKPAWSVKGPTPGGVWLAWAFGLRDKDLDEAQAALKADSYANLAELVAHGDPTWIPEPPKPPAADSAASADATPTKESQPAPAVPPEPQPKEPVAASKIAPASPAVPAPSPEPVKAAEPTPAAPPAVIQRLSEPPQPKVVHQPDQPAARPSVSEDVSRKPPTAKPESQPPAPPAPQPPTIALAWDDADAATIARRALDAKDPAVRSKHVSHLAWRWLADGETGLALHLAQASASEPSADGIPPGWLLELLHLRSWVAADQYAVCLRVHELAELHADHPLPDGGTPEQRTALRLLIAAAAMRPVLLAPSQDVGSMLSHVCGGQDSPFWKVARRLASFAGENITPSAEIIQATLSQAEWDARAEKLRTEARQWRNMARESKLSYAPATQVQAEWIKTGGFLHEILEHVGSIQESSVKALRSHLVRVDVDDEIDRVQSSVLKKRTRIEGTARRALWRRADEALSFARQWLDLLEARGTGYPSPARNHLVQLRQAVDSVSDAVAQDLGSLADANGQEAFAVRAAARIALQEFQTLRAILRGESWPKPGTVPLDHIVTRDLLRLPGWESVEESEAKSPGRIRLLLERTAAGRLSYAAAFQELCDRGRHHKTSPLLDALRETGAPADEVAKLEGLRAASVEDWRSRILGELSDTERRLNDAVGKGLMQAADFSSHLNTVQRHRENLKDAASAAEIDFELIKGSLVAVDASLNSARNQELIRVQDRLKEAALADGATVARIGQIIASGDVFLANDYIERAARGDSLPPSAELETHSHFLAFFGNGRGAAGSYDAIYALLSKKPFPAAELVRKVREGESIPELGAEPEQRAADPEYADALQSWFEVGQRKRVSGGEALIAGIVRGLGFRFRGGITPEGGSPVFRFNMECKDPVPCPVPQFGSETRGRYVILCVPQFQGVEQLLAQMGVPAGDTRGIVALVFDKLSRKDRIDLGQACQRHARNVLVLDDVLMLHLIAAGGRRLEAAFECALPFTNAMPYSITANPLAPEMFYGRRREIEAILSGSASGSCFVFGGRQIGKTVLLTEVQRRFHNPSEGHLARHIDLKAKQIGTQRQPIEIWALLAEELRACAPELLGERDKIPKKITYDWLAGHVREWLKSKPERRILLLLDEADAFLETDGRSSPTFAECDKLRDLMKSTELRFKAVLAGLHNVQRATRVANQPLVYFGEPLCIGPLITNGETRRAYDLICKPLASLGVYFENQDLPNSILARTNYYPNLIQIYCQNLLIHIRDRWTRIGSSRGAPYYVTAADLDEVYERQELRQELRAKFRLSLDLDRRFRLIANMLAYNREEHPEGMEAAAIRTQVMDWWPAGFRESGQDSRPLPYDLFRHLLDEMVGLGILRMSKDERNYSLRSPNVLVLLGTREEIERDICASSEWELAPVYTPSTFHGQMTATDPCKRSPLTAEQEAKIAEEACTAHVMLGCRAAGLDALADALRFRYGDTFAPVAEKTEEDFLRFLGKHSRRRGLGKTLLLVPSSVGWSASWVAKARQHLDRLSREDSFVGIVFECDPPKLWSLRSTWGEIESSATDVQTLHPWHDDAVRNWLDDCPFQEKDPETRKKIRAVTGNWRHLLMAMRGLHKKGTTLARILAAMEDPRGSWAEGNGLVEAFGLSEANPRSLLEFVASNPEATTEDISAFADEGSALSDPALVREGIWWAEKLDFIYPSGAGWKVDDFLARILKPAGEAGHGA